MKVGYATGTFDLPHTGHFHFLKTCKTLCNILIVGITTDETALRQKRKPVLEYSSRHAIIENCAYVDIAIPHDGQSKPEAYSRLKFDVSFTCLEEYFDSAEFDELRAQCPHVQIIGIPRFQGVSSTQSIKNYQLNLLQSSQVLAIGITGSITKFGQYYVTKTLHFAHEDLFDTTADSFRFFDKEDVKLPRNYKHLNEAQEDYPFISGIVAGREIVINEFFKSKSWNVFESCNHPRYYQESLSHTIPKNSLQEFARYVQKARKFPVATTTLIMRYEGISLQELAPTLSGIELGKICCSVLDIIEEIRDHGVLHGDIHSKNILVNPKTLQVYIIDFGWTSAQFFKLSTFERNWLTKQLSDNFDKLHFLGSIKSESFYDRIIWRE